MDGEEATAPEDVSKWTVDDVCSFVGGLSGCGEYAPVRGHLPRMVLSPPIPLLCCPLQTSQRLGEGGSAECSFPPCQCFCLQHGHMLNRGVFFLLTFSPSCTTRVSWLCFLWESGGHPGTHSPSTQALIPPPAHPPTPGFQRTGD